MKCKACRQPAVIDIPRHNAAFCADCFVRHCQEQVVRSIAAFDMMSRSDRVLVAVSGGKDSLALWDMLMDLGYQADGLYLGLGIGDYSGSSIGYVRSFAADRGATLVEVDIPAEFGFDIPTGAAAARRAPCSACGLSKRHLFNKAARDGGYDAVATGHNLDDEAAVLFGNVLRWDTAYLGRQLPVLPGTDGFARKVKPLVRLSERETAAYCVIKGIDYQVEECPQSAGNRHLGYKAALNDIEVRSPGSKAAFYFGFLERIAPLVAGVAEEERRDLHPCPECGSPTVADLCAFCALVAKATRGKLSGAADRTSG
ncbi:adenine nucleotide alpha hydrolase family protein [Acidiferrimicrobium sp. IK]|uniref:adenine nucleotide alpha hydrolase family protein n=1 Tax=Acidiferrimicrobium sp. IK TaxID=2871700 RepID=UPI0021CB9812|nr:adenine nucleotide alpha hydrolase family protein [Acidiferrimicrobium sp. IK]MCU4184654.1 adenine nucleotide alpha hydrolase family protein [Acidiferrimicrobium sp. IK]